MPLLSRSIVTAGLVLASGLSLSACATEDYVDKQIATVNDRVSALEARVNTVDQTAQQANSTAQAAGVGGCSLRSREAPDRTDLVWPSLFWFSFRRR